MSKGKRIYFYNVSIFQDEIKTNISFKKLINKVNDIGWDKKVRKIKDNVSAMFPLISIDSQMNKVIMGKFRTDYKPFIGDVADDDYRELEEEIVELCTFVYLESKRTIILEYNVHGLKRGDIEEYFNSFLPGDHYIKLTSVLKSQDIELIYKTTQVTSLSIGLNLDMYEQMRLKKHKKNLKLRGGTLTEFLDNLIHGSKELEAEETILKYKIEYNKDATMNIDIVTKLLDNLNYEDDSISKFVVNYRNIDNDAMEKMDLKKDTIDLRGRILKNIGNNNPAPEFIADTIIADLDKYNSDINKWLESYEEDINFDLFRLPDLLIKSNDGEQLKI